MKAALLRIAVAVLALVLVPRVVAGRDANAWLADDAEGLRVADALAATVIADVTAQKRDVVYRTGNARFDGQSTVAIEQMALLGLGQIVLAHPEKRDAYLPAMRAAAKRLASPATLAYATHVYGHNGLDRMDPGEGHAYLGYINLGLGMLRLVEKGGAEDADLARVHDRLTAALAARIDASPTGLIETYPGESWPPDVSAVVGSIGLHATATGTDRKALLDRWSARFERCAVHRATGMLVQRTSGGSHAQRVAEPGEDAGNHAQRAKEARKDAGPCMPADAPRGSGTALAAYFLSFATPDLAGRLYAALARNAYTQVDGFGGFREYPDGFSGHGDIDAGPIVFGVSVGATGFGLGAARAAGDRDRFVALYRSTHLFGVPTSLDGRTVFAPGGALGNALLLAMLTARRP